MIYVLVLLFLIFLSFKYDLGRNDYDSPNTKWLPVIVILFVAIAGFRDGLGVDTKQYLSFFTSVPTFDQLTKQFFAETRFRPGFVIFYSLCKTIIDDFTFAQFAEAIIVDSIVVLFIKRYSNLPYLTTLLFFLVNYLEFNMEVQREAIAVSLVLIAWMKFDDKKYVQSIIFFIASTTFHVSAFSALLIPILQHVKFNNKWIIAALLFTVIIPVLFFSIPNLQFYVQILLNTDAEQVIDIYTSQSFNSALNINAYIIHFLHYFVIIYALAYLKKNGTIRFEGIILIYITLMYMSNISYGFYRLANYYSVFYLITIADFIYLFVRTNRNVRKMPKIAALLLLLYMTYYHEKKLTIYDDINAQYCYERYFPYKSIFD